MTVPNVITGWYIGSYKKLEDLHIYIFKKLQVSLKIMWFYEKYKYCYFRSHTWLKCKNRCRAASTRWNACYSSLWSWWQSCWPSPTCGRTRARQRKFSRKFVRTWPLAKWRQSLQTAHPKSRRSQLLPQNSELKWNTYYFYYLTRTTWNRAKRNCLHWIQKKNIFTKRETR